MSFVKWPSIEKFSDVFVHAKYHDIGETIFNSKIKLHGTNAAIRIENGEIFTQKRSSDISITDDNSGFAKWVSTLKFNDITSNIIFYGEWAGNGIQNGDAITKISDKFFFIFAVYSTLTDTIILEPNDISEIIDNVFETKDKIKVLPWHGVETIVDFRNAEDCQNFLDLTTEYVDAVIGVEDPYVKEVFGVSGSGEGLVFYALDKGKYWRDFLFKVKTEVHSVQKTKVRSNIVPEKSEGIDDFINSFFTNVRFNQILVENFGSVADKSKTGDFLKAVFTDVFKESKNELEASNFEWKEVVKTASSVIKIWFFKKCEELKV